jgi:hypothetical protein
MEAEIANKIKNLKVDNPLQGIKSFISVRPVGCKTKDTIVQDLQAFQFVMSKIPEKEY